MKSRRKSAFKQYMVRSIAMHSSYVGHLGLRQAEFESDQPAGRMCFENQPIAPPKFALISDSDAPQ